jgi:hypothetical protein
VDAQGLEACVSFAGVVLAWRLLAGEAAQGRFFSELFEEGAFGTRFVAVLADVA